MLVNASAEQRKAEAVPAPKWHLRAVRVQQRALPGQCSSLDGTAAPRRQRGPPCHPRHAGWWPAQRGTRGGPRPGAHAWRRPHPPRPQARRHGRRRWWTWGEIRRGEGITGGGGMNGGKKSTTGTEGGRGWGSPSWEAGWARTTARWMGSGGERGDGFTG
jgi:hypothetical protein